MLKGNSFSWNEEVEKALWSLKYAMCTTPVLSLPNFKNTFVLECDSLGKGTGNVLIQTLVN